MHTLSDAHLKHVAIICSVGAVGSQAAAALARTISLRGLTSKGAAFHTKQKSLPQQAGDAAAERAKGRKSEGSDYKNVWSQKVQAFPKGSRLCFMCDCFNMGLTSGGLMPMRSRCKRVGAYLHHHQDRARRQRCCCSEGPANAHLGRAVSDQKLQKHKGG